MELVALLLLAFATVLAVSSMLRIAKAALQDDGLDNILAEDGDASRLGELAERKEMVMQLILSTELDHQTAKISDQDRELTIARLKRDAVQIMKQMDALAGDVEDAERAERELSAFLTQARAADGDRRWSAAARLRHGGTQPANEGT